METEEDFPRQLFLALFDENDDNDPEHRCSPDHGAETFQHGFSFSSGCGPSASADVGGDTAEPLAEVSWSSLSERPKERPRPLGSSSLLRLFESQFCDASMAISYFFNTKNEGVMLYLGNKFFSYDSKDVSWYLIQLIHMYVYMDRTQPVLYHYLTRMSSANLKFSLLTTWLLEAYLLGFSSPSAIHTSAIRKLLNSIVSTWCSKATLVTKEEIPTSVGDEVEDPLSPFLSPSQSPSSSLPLGAEINPISYFISERSFVTELVLIGKRLRVATSKTSRMCRLHSELLTLDRSLSQPVFIPTVFTPDHVIVRIPYKDSSVLNSKEKIPYLVYVEVIEKEDALKSYSNLVHHRHRELEKYFVSMDLAETTLSQDESLPTCDVKPLRRENKYCVRKIRENIMSYSEPTRFGSVSIASDDPSAAVLSEPWKQKYERIKASSPFGRVSGWNLYSIIVKYGDDLRQDYLAYQFLKKCMDVWRAEHLSLWVRPYGVVITESQAGIIEAITDAVSIHQIKNRHQCSLEEYFRLEYGHNSDSYSVAKKKFVQSLAGYSLFQYIFQVKDRHNGNILLDLEGHIIHVDFGFVLGQSPKGISFEASPFKMTYDFLELVEGKGSDFFLYFKSLLFHGFQALRKHMSQLMILVEVLKLGNQMQCLGKNGNAVVALERRFHLDLNDEQLSNLIDRLVDQSTNSLTTVLYDKFQYYTNGIIS